LNQTNCTGAARAGRGPHKRASFLSRHSKVFEGSGEPPQLRNKAFSSRPEAAKREKKSPIEPLYEKETGTREKKRTTTRIPTRKWAAGRYPRGTVLKERVGELRKGGGIGGRMQEKKKKREGETGETH